MYHVECIDIHKDDALYMYLDRACSCANNMRNTANFYIRNLMTGLKKVPSARTENEAFVIGTVSGAVPGINRQLLEKRDRKVLRIMGDKSLSEEARAKKAAAVKYLQFTVPTAEKWFASYGLLDAVFKRTDNRDYRAFHAHVMQNAVRDCCEAWLSYFEGLKAYAPGSGHTGKPKIPGYKKSGGRSTAVFSSLACTVRHGTLFFPYGVDGGGKKSRCSVRVSRLPHSSKDKLIEVRAVPYFGYFQLQVVTDDGVPEGSLLPDVKDIINADGGPAGVMTLDPGLECFAAIADNMGNTPIVIKGGALKARNQWFNKRLAALKSEQMGAMTPESFHPCRPGRCSASPGSAPPSYGIPSTSMPITSAGCMKAVHPLYHHGVQQGPEAGSASGAGTTRLSVAAFREVQAHPRLHCREVRHPCHLPGGKLYLKSLFFGKGPPYPGIR